MSAPVPTPDVASALALLQGPQQEGWLQRALAFLFVFFVVIWPIIRGVIEAANQRRQQFEREQRKGGAAPRRRPTLEEILGGGLEADDSDGPPPLPWADARRADARQAEGRGAPAGPKARSVRAPSAPAPAQASPEDWNRPAHRDLVGDPFDDSHMGEDLVDDSILADIPTEDELESNLAFNEATAAAAVRQRSLDGDLRDARPRALRPAEATLASLERRLTPWQRALVMREMLGPPRATDPYDAPF